MRYYARTSDDGARCCSGGVQTREPGAVVRTLQLAGGQTNRAPALSRRIKGSDPSPRRWVASTGVRREGSDPAPERGLPSTQSRGREPGCGKVISPIPRRVGGQAIQAPGGRRRRPSRAFFVPLAIRSEANGREPGRPAPPSQAKPRGLSPAGVAVLDEWCCTISTGTECALKQPPASLCRVQGESDVLQTGTLSCFFRELSTVAQHV